MKKIRKIILKINDALEKRLYKEPIDLFENKVLIYYPRLVLGILLCWIRLYLIISGLVWSSVLLPVIFTRQRITVSDIVSKNINLVEIMRTVAIGNILSYLAIAIFFVAFSVALGIESAKKRYLGTGRWHREPYLLRDTYSIIIKK